MNSNLRIALIPAYEPETILLDVLQKIRESGIAAVVVDDGSGQAFADIFKKAAEFAVILAHQENRGKGFALKTGLQYISEHFDGQYVAVTADADGQHQISDILKVCEAAEQNPDALVLGSRLMHENVPLRSRFGNAVTRCIYGLSTGLNVHDTQTGLRAFSSSLIPDLLKIKGDRYEYEMNVLLEFSRRKIPIKEIEISTIYINNNSASHFDTIKDSYRIYKEIIMFSASSFVGFITDYGFYMLLSVITAGLGSTVSIPLSNIAARVVSSGINYTINKKLIFKEDKRFVKSAVQYFMLASIILAGNTVLLSLLVNKLNMNKYAAKIITEITFFISSWLVQRFIIFRPKNTTQNKD